VKLEESEDQQDDDYYLESGINFSPLNPQLLRNQIQRNGNLTIADVEQINP